MKYLITLFLGLTMAPMVLAQDMPLSMVLLPGENWKLAKASTSFVALTADAKGNLYAADLSGAIHQLNTSGKWSIWFAPSGSVSFLSSGTDGSILAVIPTKKRIVRIKSSKESVVQDGVTASGIVETPEGHLFYTVAGNNSIHLIGKREPVADNLVSPTGLTVWKDGKTLVVGESAGKHLVVFRILQDGSLDARERYYPLRVRRNQPSKVSALTLDIANRLYAATAEGVQIFDPTGRMSGVLSRPVRSGVTAVAFAGPARDRLYILCGGKLYFRKTQTQGAVLAKSAP